MCDSNISVLIAVIAGIYALAYVPGLAFAAGVGRPGAGARYFTDTGFWAIQFRCGRESLGVSSWVIWSGGESCLCGGGVYLVKRGHQQNSKLAVILLRKRLYSLHPALVYFTILLVSLFSRLFPPIL